MANAMFGYANAVLSGEVSAGSEVGGLTAGNLQNPHGSDASAWRTAGARTPDAGAWFVVNAGAAATWRAFLLAGTNLTSTAVLRWRVGGPTGIFPEAPLFVADFIVDAPTLPAGAVFSRSASAGTGEATYFGLDGTLTVAPADAPRFAHDPATLVPMGLLIEPASTNAVRNPRAEFTGTPTLPTTSAPINWAHGGFGGLTSTIVNRGEENGLPFVDVRFVGTAATGSGNVWFDSGTGVASVPTERWAFSVFHRLIAAVSGSISGATLFLSELSSGGSVVATQSGAVSAPAGGGLATQRQSASLVMTGTGTVSVRPSLGFNFANGATDITVRVAAPQMEKGLHFSTSPIFPPAGARVAQLRGADEMTWPLPATYSGTAGTLFAEQTTTGITLSAAPSVGWVRLDDGSSANNNVIGLRAGSGAGTRYVDGYIYAGGVTQADALNTNFQSGGVQRSAVAWAPADFLTYGDGLSKGAGAPVTMPAVSRLAILSGARIGYIRKFALYAARLAAGQVKQLSADGTTLDPTAVAYDSGFIAAGVVPGFGQSLHVAPADVAGQYARCDLIDPANPDGFLSVALAFAGPVWQPAVNVSPDTALGAARGQDAVRSRAGATFLTPRFYERGWTIAHDAVAQADLWSQLMPLDRAAAQGDNILFVPDPASPNVNRETVFGILETTAAIGLRTPTGEVRSWRARIAERL